MLASVKLELWYLDTPEMMDLMEKEGVLTAKGAMLTLFECLRLSHNAVGHRRMLKRLAHDCQCDPDWLWHIVTDYGLFEYNADETFSSPYLSETLGISRKKAPSRGRARYNARYNEDNNDNNHNEDKEKTHTARVCPEGTQQDASDSPSPPPTAYLGYDRLIDGRRYGYRGEPVADDAPEQVSQDTRWSWIHSKWIPRAQWNRKRESKEYERLTKQTWQTKENGRS